MSLVRWILLGLLVAGCGDPSVSADGCPQRRSLAGNQTDHRAAHGLWMIEYSRPFDSVSVRKFLLHPSPRVRRRAALAAGRIASPGLSRQVFALLGDEDATVRAAAAWGLGLAQESRAAEPLLLRVALDDDPQVRVAALRSLGLVGGAGAARALLKLVAIFGPGPGSGPRADPVRTQVWLSLALLARRGSTLTQAAAPLALTRLENKATPPPERRAAAYLLATLVQRYTKVRRGISIPERKRLKVRFGTEDDAEARMHLGRAVIRLGLLSTAELAGLARRGGTLGRLALGRLVKRDGAKGVVVGPLVDDWVKTLSATACRTVSPVMLWQALGGLASGPRRPWLKAHGQTWFQGVRAAQKKAAVGSCAAHQLARLACRAAALADLTRGRIEHLDKCSGGGLSADQEQAFVAWGLARGVARRPFRRLRRLWVQGKVGVRTAILTAAGRLGGDPGHALISRGLASKDPAIFGAGASACGVLLKAPGAPAMTPVKHSCLVAARRQFLALTSPPVHAQLYRWLELTRLVRDIADNAVVGRLKIAARHHHPTLRNLARAALASVLGRPPATATWSADRRPPPADPLAAPGSVTLRTAAGPITLRLRPDWAPLTAAYFSRLVSKGAYGQSSFHRVVPGFVVQGGDPTGTGFGGDTTFLLSELSDARFVRGVVGLAHAGRDTESSQLFITLGPAPHLDGHYTAFAVVTAGLENADHLLPGARFQILPAAGNRSSKAVPHKPAPMKSSPMKSAKDGVP